MSFSAHLDTLGFNNGAPPSKPTWFPFRFAAPEPIHPLRQHRLTPYPTLCASLEAYYSRSSPFLFRLPV